MNTSSSSISPIERRSWRCVPSPQSNSIRSPPRRTRIDGSERRAVGADPAVPMKRTSRSMSIELYVLEADRAVVADVGHAHRVPWLAALVGRAARIEDVEAAELLVQRDVRVPEHDRVRAAEAGPHARQA